MKILLVNGPNLDMLGVREPAVYGSNTLVDLEKLVVDYGASKGVSVECYQSNHEGFSQRGQNADRQPQRVCSV